MTVKHKEIINRIMDYHPAIPPEGGCDGYKIGNPEEECTGIVSALVPTMEVIAMTIQLGCNLIITHEPLFYQTPDFGEWRGAYENKIYLEKRKFIEKNHITIWRDHDRMHSHRPDCIFAGVIKYLGWEAYYRPARDREVMYYSFTLPETTVEALGEFLKQKLNLNGLKYMGNPKDTISRVAIVGHLFPNCFYPDGLNENGFYYDYAMELMEQMERKEGIEAIIPGEIIEWTVLSYIRDALYQKKVKACFNIGHFNMEELGMKYARDWIEELVEQTLPVYYVPTGDGFQYI